MTTFIVDGQEKSLVMIGQNGIDWSNDFIGNTSHGMDHDEEGNYIASPEDFEWWQNMIDSYQAMQSMIAAYQDKYGSDEVDEWLQKTHAFDTDLEYQPNSVADALRSLDE